MTERRLLVVGAGAGIEPSVGSIGDSYDNALAESVIGLFKPPWPRNHVDLSLSSA